ncbi:ABC transporter permease [Bifidobacterium pullorum subsp. saeculare]|uniref:ABC transporter permease n=1 Tax=Bifidobacterium pullorum subsp. saeculare TaxID=78257 RepID=A0A938WWA1_9BIFI|nr:ABC transporter permease [Bifidobacterium pullorum]MBM6698775.1 ABC transporter permease [Bifidobacterium pullorum subsp. saeculare]
MRFLAQRLMLFVAALFALSVLVFAALRILPGDVAAVMAGMNATAGQVARLRTELGLDRPLAAQYGDWLAALLHGDLGVSAFTGRSVTAEVAQRAQVTFPLIGMTMALALTAGIPLGCAAALARRPAVRGAFRLVAIVAGAVPALWSGLLLILLFARGSGLVGLFPSQGFPMGGWRQPGAAFASLTLPAVASGLIVAASLMRHTRSALGEQLEGGAVAMGMACGMTRTEAALRIGLRLATPQLVSVAGLTLAQMVTSVMVVENLFALPGIGAMLVTDVGNRDLIAVQSELFLLAAFFLLVGLLVDLAHHALDPRLAAGADREGGRA